MCLLFFSLDSLDCFSLLWLVYFLIIVVSFIIIAEMPFNYTRRDSKSVALDRRCGRPERTRGTGKPNQSILYEKNSIKEHDY